MIPRECPVAPGSAGANPGMGARPRLFGSPDRVVGENGDKSYSLRQFRPAVR